MNIFKLRLQGVKVKFFAKSLQILGLSAHVTSLASKFPRLKTGHAHVEGLEALGFGLIGGVLGLRASRSSWVYQGLECLRGLKGLKVWE